MSLLLLALLNAAADDAWAEFRGPAGAGHSTSTGLPKEWSESKNVTWKTALHGRGWSSPVVWGSQVWLTTGTPDGNELSVLCVDRESGKILLDQKLFEPKEPDPLWKKYNSYASPTPALEEGRVYVHFGTYGTACLDTKTLKPVWIRTDLHCNHWRGAGSSPILYENLLILTFDGHDVQYVVALDKKTGKDVWKTAREHKMDADGDRKKGYSTPIVIDVGGRPQLISPASAGTVSLDPKTGQLLWWVAHKGHSPAMRSLYADGLVIFGVGAGSEFVAVKPDGKGDVSATHIAWKATGKGVGHKPSPIVVDGLMYSVHDGGVANCFDAKTGKEVWMQRLGGAYSASPLYADGVLWFFSEDGTCTIVQPGREYKELGKNKLDGGAESKSTPAIAGKSIFYRTSSALYRIDAK